MNRKRFIKYLMGKGLPRNKAEYFAAALNRSMIPYHSCQVGNIVRLSDGSYSGTCVFPKAIIPMLISKESRRLETGLSEDDVKILMHGKSICMNDTAPVSRVKAGWNETEMQKWLKTDPMGPPLPKRWRDLIDAARYATSVYNLT